MFRSIVVRNEDHSGKINVNDEIGLDPHCSYTLAEHLEDLRETGLELVVACGPVHLFQDGTKMVLTEEVVAVDLGLLDDATNFALFCGFPPIFGGEFPNGRTASGACLPT